MSEHRNLTGASLHEPKGVAAASAETYYKANGSGSGAWSPLFPLTTTVWDDYVVPIVGANATGASAPALIKVNDDGAGSTGVFAYNFIHTAEREVMFILQLPHRVKAGTSVKPHIHWEAGTAGAGNVIWGLEYVISNIGVAAGGTTIIKTAATATSGAVKTQQITGFPEIVGTNIKESTLINCRLFRDATNVLDTYAAGAIALNFDIHFRVEKLGSVEEYPGAGA